MRNNQTMSKLLGTCELTKWSLYRALIAEFMGTLIFLYVSIATVIGYKNQSSAEACTGVGYLGVAWSFGATIFVLVYCTSGISGGHINPAVTFGQLVARKLSLVRAVLYIVAQCLGAICGVGIVKGIMKHPYDSLGGGANTVADGYSVGSALAAEIVGTFILVYTVFSATDPIDVREESDPECTAQDSFVPVQVHRPVGDGEESDPKSTARDSVPVLPSLPIGFAVFVVHLATIPVTGTGINPARSLGAAVLYNQHKAWKDHWIFWVGPLIGATVAALYHKLVLSVATAKARS